MPTNSTLSWTVVPPSEDGFLRAPVLVTGPTEAVLIDAGFTYADGQAMVEAIRASGKRLKMVYITVNDPDFYFNLPVIKEAFPDVQILAASDSIALMRRKAEGKIEKWSPKLGDNGPKSVAELVFPEPSDLTSLSVDGETIEIVNEPGVKDRGRYLWVPSLRAVFGGVPVFGGMYPWVADLPTVAERQAWIAALEGILARKPDVVVAGHMTADWPTDTSGVTYTRDYLVAFEAEAAKAADSAALIAAMKQLYPNEAMEISLVLGAKVAKGEMTWG
jgi:glyoxylase-like metal-dependent hydrolase (beta-lactamase superfamily II)